MANEKVLVQRSDKVGFWGVVSESATIYTRMHGFTSLTESKNAKEYSRQYIDKPFEESDVTGYAPSIEFGFDEYTNDSVLSDIVDIFESEKIGTDAVREVIFVDFSKPVTGGGFEAKKRSFAVVADGCGDGTDAYQYSGSFKAKSGITKGTAVIATPSGGDKQSAETITFTAESAE